MQQLPRANIQYHIPDTFAQKHLIHRKSIISGGPPSGCTPSDMHRELSWNYHNKAIYSLWNHFVDVCMENQQSPQRVYGSTGGTGGARGNETLPLHNTSDGIGYEQNGGTVYTSMQNTGTVTWWQTQGGQQCVGSAMGFGSGLGLRLGQGLGQVPGLGPGSGLGQGPDIGCGFGPGPGVGCGLGYDYPYPYYDGYGYDDGTYGGYEVGEYIHYEHEKMCEEQRFYESNERVCHTSLLYHQRQTIIQNNGGTLGTSGQNNGSLCASGQNSGTDYEQNTGTVSSITTTSSSVSPSTPTNYRNRHICDAWRLPMFVQLGYSLIRFNHNL